jgi:tetratricopeptide (TPR) repeat protein
MTTALLLALSLAVVQQDTPRVPLYANLGSYHRPVSSRVARAQAYFDQGLRLAYAFNQEESIRAFREAARLDPKCGICWWGVAYAYGPNVNLPMDSASNAAAWNAIANAKAQRAHAAAAERDLIDALALRYGPAAGPRGDSAYMRAAVAIASKYPNDVDAATLAAEARMLLRPWNYWMADGQPYDGTTELVATLERALRQNPLHPGACHFYIHAVEAAQPEKAVACAEGLAALMPGAGHLVHMPGHIYIRVGRWNDAIEANVHALHEDELYIASEKPSGVYPVAYYPHNHHFLAFAATMAGRAQLAIEHARGASKATPAEAAAAFVVLQPIVAYPFLTLTTFGKWDELIAEPNPPANLRIANGLAAYAKGIAHAAKGHGDVARTLLDTLTAIAMEVDASAGNADRVLDIAQHALMAEIALRAKDLAGAEQHFAVAHRLEKEMTYIEPPDWYYPIAHSLGAVLLAQGKAAEAETMYRGDLKLYAENVWSLKGLALALHAQEKHAEAAEVDARLGRALEKADVTLTGSRY